MIRPHPLHELRPFPRSLVTLAACALPLLAGCAQSGYSRFYEPRPIEPVTQEWLAAEAESAPSANSVQFSTAAVPVSASFVTTANLSQFGGPPSSALTTDARNISVFGEVTPDMAPERTSRSNTLDGDDNLTRITYSPVGGDYDPDLSPDGEYMVFSSTQHHPTADIYLKRVDGRSVTQLTSDPAHDVMPTFSPDGQRIAFASDRAGNWDIYVMSLAGGQPMQVTTDASQELHASWSPDGSQLVYSRLSTQSGRWELWVADLENAGTHQFLCYGLFPEWSPNPSRPQITFQRARERDSRLFGVWTIDYRNGEATSATEVASATNAALINPTWSPDAAYIVFAAVLEPFLDTPSSAQVADLWMVDGAGMHRVNLTNGRFACLMPEWATSGKIYFVSNREGVENIWAIGPERGLLAAAPNGFSANLRTATTTPTQNAQNAANKATAPAATPTTTPADDTATATVPTEIFGELPNQ